MLENTARNVRASLGKRGWNRAVNLVDRSRQPEACSSLPTDYWIEVTNRCNLRCRMCRRRFVLHDAVDMDRSLFKVLTPFLGYALRAELNCWGESLVAPDMFGAVFDYISAMPVWMQLTTNAMLLDERWARKFLGASMEIVVSLDGAGPGTFESIRSGADFGRVLRNIRRLGDLKEDAGKRYPILSLKFVAMADNAQELPALVPLAEDLGAENIYVVYLVAHSEEMRCKSLFYDSELARAAFEDARRAACGRQVSLWLPRPVGVDAESAADPWRRCREPWYAFVVKSNGDVNPCCHTPDLVMGNLKKSGFESIWNGGAYRRLRKALREGTPPPSCLHCHMSFPDVNDESSHVKIVRSRGGQFCGYEFD